MAQVKPAKISFLFRKVPHEHQNLQQKPHRLSASAAALAAQTFLHFLVSFIPIHSTLPSLHKTQQHWGHSQTFDSSPMLHLQN